MGNKSVSFSWYNLVLQCPFYGGKTECDERGPIESFCPKGTRIHAVYDILIAVCHWAIAELMLPYYLAF